MANFEIEKNTQLKLIIEVIQLTFHDNEDIYSIVNAYYADGFSQLGRSQYSKSGRVCEMTLYKYVGAYENNIFKRIFAWLTLK
jgi:hypothetical protein